MKFVVEISASFSDGIVDLSPYLTNVVVNHDYVDKTMPMWAFSFKMPYEIKRRLQDYDFTLPFKIYSIKTNNTLDDDPYASNEDIIYDELIYDDEIIEYNKTYSDTKQITDDEGTGTDIKTIPYSISGLSKSIMQINSSILNGVYRDTTSLNALLASIQDLNTNIKITTNGETLVNVYKQIIIPPMNLIPAVRHVLGYYPVYAAETGIFFNDKNNLHLFSNTDKALDTRIDLEIVENSQEMQYKPEDFTITRLGEKYYGLKSNITPVFNTTKKINDALLGIDKIIYSYDDIFNAKHDRSVDVNNIYEKKRIYWDRSGIDTATTILNDIYSRNRTSSITLLNVDPRLLNQYTYFNIEGPEAINYIKGKYSLRTKTELYTSSGKNYTIFTNEINVLIENVVE